MKPKSEETNSEVITCVPSTFVVSEFISMRQLQDDYISFVLSTCDDDLDRAAEKLGITSRTIYNRIRSGNVLRDKNKV